MTASEQRMDRDERGVAVTAFGDDADELEMDALAKAAEFFGSGVPLVLGRYTARRAAAESAANTGGKVFGAGLVVYAGALL